MSTLNPYTGDWTFEHAAHLLRRTTYGPNRTEINNAVSKGLNATVNELLRDVPMPDPPIYYNFTNDPQVAVGETWVNTIGDGDISGLTPSRNRSLRAWYFGQQVNHQSSIRERMSLFWHEHFPFNAITRPEVKFQYINAIQENHLGNFRTIVEEMTISNAMLIFLNGTDNTRQSPNENYARELLELFTIGRGPIVGPGDYTNYTEEDVFAIAKALTGWRVTAIDNAYQPIFVPNRHDESDKQLSARFDNAIISNNGANEYKDVIDIILNKKETARYICRQLHIWFVGSDINQDVEDHIIAPMADIFYDGNYEIAPVVEALLLSEYFHDPERRGCIIASPLDFILGTINTFDLAFPAELTNQYFVWNRLERYASAQLMEVFEVDSVAGWKAYYQAPQFYEFWINSVSLNSRREFANIILEGRMVNGYRYELDLVKFIEEFENPSDPNDLIEEIGKVLFVFPLAENQKDYLKNVLLPGLDDFVWTVEYGIFLEDPSNEEARSVIENKLKALFITLLQMPEYHLI